MALDVIITPASGLVDFQNSGISSATIQLDGTGNLNISASAGDIQIGDTASDVYIGDGVNNVDIVFEQSGEIRGLTGKTITLGQSDSFIAFAGDVTGDVTFTGKLVFPDNGTVPDNPTNEQYDYMTFGANGSISQVSGRGALMIASSDDSLILANGDVGRTFTSSNINVDPEDIFLLSDGAVRVKTDLQNGWGSENTYVFSGGYIEATTFTSTQATGTAPFTVSSTTVVSNLNADTVDGIQASSFLRSDASDTATGDITIAKSTAPTFTVKTTAGSSYDALIKIGGARTGSSSSDISKISFTNETSSAYTLGEISAMDPSANHASGNGKLVFRTSSGGTLSDKLVIPHTGNPTYDGNTLWHAGNDGASSGLDADLLDGQQGSYYTNASNINAGTLAIARGGTNSSATPTNGGVAYGTGSAYAFTSAGTSGQVLSSNGSAAPTWEDAGGGAFEYDNTSNIFSSSITSLSSRTTATHNFLAGTDAGQSITVGSNNNFIGNQAGYCNTTGSCNNFFGQCAGYCNTTGCYNNFIGRCAGYCNTTGTYNNFIGILAGFWNNTGSCNNFFGYRAGYCNTTGSCNNFFGRCAGHSNTTGVGNNFIGNSAGFCNTTGGYNNFFGSQAGYSNTTGCDNNFIGYRAGYCNTTGGCNNFFGYQAGRSNTTGRCNNFFGQCAGYSNTTGCGNNFIGSHAGRCNTTGSCNNFIGLCAGYSNTTGNNNNFFGQCAGNCNTTGTSNNFFGLQAGCYNTTGSNNNFIGYFTGYCNTTGTGNNFFGYSAGRSNTTGCCNNFIGLCAGYSNTSGNFNNFIGRCAGFCNTTGVDNNFFGNQAGCCNTTGGCNNFFGYLAGLHNTTGFSNNFFGNQAGLFNTSGGCNNFIGLWAGRNNTIGKWSNFFGYLAGYANTTGCNNTFIGYFAGRSNTTASNNIAIGCCSGYSTNGLDNLTTTSNRIVMGNNAHTNACIQIAWSVASDIRYKCVWGNVSHGRHFLRGVNPIEYSFKDKYTEEVTDTRRRYGFSAQEILALEGDNPVIVKNDNPDNLGITHDHLIPILVNAIKELDAENKSILARLDALENA